MIWGCGGVILVIDKHGAYVSKRGETIVISVNGEKSDPIAARNLSLVVTLGKVSFSNDALLLLAKYAVPVVFTTGWTPRAIFHPFFNHGTVITRREQIKAYDDWRGLHLAKQFAISALENKARFLLYLLRNRNNQSIKDVVNTAVTKIRFYVSRIESIEEPLHVSRSSILGFEGMGTKEYFNAFQLFFNEELEFFERNRRPPRDPVNAALSFGYTLLYSKALICVSATGLEPYAGFLHTDRSGKPSLMLDLAEEFKQWAVDRVVVRLFSMRILSKQDFKISEGRVLFTEDGKKKFLNAFSERLNKKVSIRASEEPVSIMRLLLQQARKIARFVLQKDTRYEPFIWTP